MQNQPASAELLARTQPLPAMAKRELEQFLTLRLVCETTNDSFDYEVPSDAGTLKDLWDRRLMVSCPHCRKVHGFLFRTAYVDSVLSVNRLTFERL